MYIEVKNAVRYGLEKRLEPIKSYAPSKVEGITVIYKWAVKLNSPKLAWHDAAVNVCTAWS